METDDPWVVVHGACALGLALALFKQVGFPGGNVGDNKDGLFYSGSFRVWGAACISA